MSRPNLLYSYLCMRLSYEAKNKYSTDATDAATHNQAKEAKRRMCGKRRLISPRGVSFPRASKPTVLRPVMQSISLIVFSRFAFLSLFRRDKVPLCSEIPKTKIHFLNALSSLVISLVWCQYIPITARSN